MNTLFPHVQIPLISPPMAGVSGGQLAASVTNAGGFGFIGVGHVSAPVAFLTDEIGAARAQLPYQYHDAERLPIGVGVFVWKLDLMERKSAEELLRSAARHSSCVWLSFGEPGRPKDWVQFLKGTPEAAGCTIAVLVNTIQEVESLLLAEVQHIPDMLIVQSQEAGGHGSPHALPFISFMPAVLSSLTTADLDTRGRKRPLLIAAGGIVTGAQIVSALALGADGVACGTLFASCEESTYLPAQKDLIVSTKGEDAVRTIIFDQMRGTTLWPDPIDGRGIRNQTLLDAAKMSSDTDFETLKAAYGQAVASGDVTRIVTWAGTSVGEVKKVESAADIVKRLKGEMSKSLNALNRWETCKTD